MQLVFNPADFDFKWTEGGNWYEWDRKSAHSKALKARNAEAKRLKEEGYFVTKFTLREQLITRGGIGSGCAQIDVVVNCYGINANK